jgi:hypothetical protein
MQAAYLRRLEQTTLEPTIPLSASSQASGSMKKKESASPITATAGAIPPSSQKKKKPHAGTASPQKVATPVGSPNVTQ